MRNRWSELRWFEKLGAVLFSPLVVPMFVAWFLGRSLFALLEVLGV